MIIDEVSSEVRRTLEWLEDEQKPYWHNQVRLRQRALEEVQNEIFGAKLSQFRDSNDAQQMAMHRAKRALRDAEEKLKRIKAWSRRYQSDVEPLGREVEKLQTLLAQDLKKAAALLERILRTLDEYAERRQSLDSEGTGMLDDLEQEQGESDASEINTTPEIGKGDA